MFPDNIQYLWSVFFSPGNFRFEPTSQTEQPQITNHHEQRLSLALEDFSQDNFIDTKYFLHRTYFPEAALLWSVWCVPAVPAKGGR